jgi:hypothetical protein
MKILVLYLQGAKRAKLFGDERLANLRRLMDMGCFGELDGNSREWNVLARHATHTLTLAEFLTQADQDVATFEDFCALQSKLASQQWDYCQLTAALHAGGGSSDPYLNFDQGLGEALQHLSDDTMILVMGEGCFVLVSANNPISGYQNGSTLDITPTMLELAGYPLPASTEGKSWVAGMELNNTSGLTDDEQDLLRERLSGLGYI